MKRLLIWLLGCCLLPALAWGADAARWEQLMEDGHRVGVLGYSHLYYGDWNQAVRAFKTAVREAEGFDPADPRLADSLDALALYYLHTYNMEQRDYTMEAKDCILRAKYIRVTAYGKDSPEIARSLCMVAHLYTHLEDPAAGKQVVPLYKRALTLAERGFGNQNVKLAEVYLLAAPQFDGEGDIDGHALVDRAIAIAETAYGKDDPRLLDILYRAMPDYLDLQDTEAAQGCLTRAVAMLEKAYGADDPRLVPALYRLADYQAGPRDSHTYVNDEKMEYDLPATAEVVATLERAGAILRKAYGEESPKVIPALLRLGKVMGGTETAWTAFEQALAIADKAYGPDDPRVLDSLLALAEWAGKEDPSSAELHHARAEKLAAALPDGDPRQLQVLAALAIWHRRAARYEEAAAACERAIAAGERNPAADVDRIIACFHLLILIAQDQDLQEPATAAADRLLAFVARRCGPRSDEMLDQLNVVTRFISLYDSPRSMDWKWRKLSLEEARCGKDSPQVAETLEDLARDLAQNGDAEGAIDCYRRALAIYGKLKMTDARLVNTLESLAGLLQDEKRYAEAEPYLLRVVAAYHKEPHQLLRAQFALSENYHKLRKYAQAELVLREMMAATTKPGSSDELPEQVLARCLIEQGKYAQADAMLRERQAAAERASEPNLVLVANLLCARYDLYLQWGKAKEAAACFARLDQMAAQPASRNQPNPAEGALYRLAESLRGQQRLSEEEMLLKRLLAAAEKRSETEAGYYLQVLAQNALARQQPAEAGQYYERLLAIDDAQAEKETDGPRRDSAYFDEIVQFLSDQGNDARAEEILRRRLTLDEKQTGADMQLHADRWQDIARVLVRQHKYADAETIYQRLLIAQENTNTDSEQPSDLNLAVTQRLLAECYAAWGKPEQAEPLFAEALRLAERIKKGPNGEYLKLADFLTPYAAFLRAQGREEEAATLERRAK